MDDISVQRCGSDFRDCRDFCSAGLDTEIIAASVRNPIHVTDCALAGADIATVPYAVIEQMTKHPLTDQGIAKFQADYKAVLVNNENVLAYLKWYKYNQECIERKMKK